MRKNSIIRNRSMTPNILGWDGYHISKHGRLYRYYNRRLLGGVWMLMKGTVKCNRSYHILRNRKTGKRIRIQTSILVARAWIPNPDNKPYVCHKDNNPLNNNHTNLYWGTQKENIAQCIHDGRFRPKGKIPLTKDIIEAINQDYKFGYPLKEISLKYNITHIHRYLYKDTLLRRKR